MNLTSNGHVRAEVPHVQHDLGALPQLLPGVPFEPPAQRPVGGEVGRLVGRDLGPSAEKLRDLGRGA